MSFSRSALSSSSSSSRSLAQAEGSGLLTPSRAHAQTLVKAKAEILASWTMWTRKQAIVLAVTGFAASTECKSPGWTLPSSPLPEAQSCQCCLPPLGRGLLPSRAYSLVTAISLAMQASPATVSRQGETGPRRVSGLHGSGAPDTEMALQIGVVAVAAVAYLTRSRERPNRSPSR